MHAQIDLLRQTILRLRQDAAVRKVEEHDELEILRRKIVDLEKFPSLAATAPQGTAGVRLDKVESRLQELEKGRPISVSANVVQCGLLATRREVGAKQRVPARLSAFTLTT